MRAVSRAAEGFDRRASTVSEILRMQEGGILSDEERFELIAGEIVLMQAKGPVHETLKSALAFHLGRALPETLWFGVEATLYLTEDSFEVSASSLTYDRGFKAELYARHKIPEYWVVDAFNRTTYQSTEPHSHNWRYRVERGPDETLTQPALPGFSIRLSEY